MTERERDERAAERSEGQLPEPRALVFDLDGTLVDSRRDIAEACNEARAVHGLPPLPFERIATMIGDGARMLVVRAFDLAPDDPFVEDALASFKRAYTASPCVHTTLLPGAKAALSTGLPNALVTNKPRGLTLLVLDALGIDEAFEAIWAGDDGPLKPSPAGILDVLRRIEVPPARAWMIGDGPQDVAAARAAGSVAIAIHGIAELQTLTSAAPDRTIDSLDAIPKLVAGAALRGRPAP